jgi:hypothetical protein
VVEFTPWRAAGFDQSVGARTNEIEFDISGDCGELIDVRRPYTGHRRRRGVVADAIAETREDKQHHVVVEFAI